MKRYHGGELVSRGIYWNMASLEFFQGGAQGVALPGGADQRYVWVPAPLVLLLGPLMGLAYIIFLPLVGIVGLVAFVGGWLGRLVERVFQEAAQVVVPSYMPGISYLVRVRRSKERRLPEAQKPHSEASDQVLRRLEQELLERRRRGEK